MSSYVELAATNKILRERLADVDLAGSFGTALVVPSIPRLDAVCAKRVAVYQRFGSGRDQISTRHSLPAHFHLNAGCCHVRSSKALAIGPMFRVSSRPDPERGDCAFTAPSLNARETKHEGESMVLRHEW